MNFTSHPYIETARFSAAFNGGDTVALPQSLSLEDKKFNECYALHIDLDKGPAACPLPDPLIHFSIFDPYNMLSSKRSFLVTDFLAGNDRKFQSDLMKWFQEPAKAAPVLSVLFTEVSNRIQPDMAQPLPEPPDTVKRRAYRF